MRNRAVTALAVAPRRIYLASSWRNEGQPALVRLLRAAGHLVYDFRDPPSGSGGFQWTDIDPGWQGWKPHAFRNGAGSPGGPRWVSR